MVEENNDIIMEEECWEIKPEILAYLAGIIDGEGCIAIESPSGHKSVNRQHRLAVRCTMMDSEAIKLLCLAFPGSYRYDEKRGGTYEWAVLSSRAYSCLQQLLPYLRVKRYQAVVGMAFQETCIKKVGGNKKLTEYEIAQRDRYMKQLSDMKHEKL